ncbi:MAG: D-alanyl-D-alanine carboxypeptidase [Lachnospiraceae bacterium]|nr:D-alanyl-D-alanine carboxypeptidase [Lachnospiraceae bacterium]
MKQKHFTALSGSFHKKIKSTLLGLFTLSLAFTTSATVLAAPETADQRLERHRAMTIESNQVQDWPQGPVVNAGSAILMEAETGTILYAKNIHSKEYPASITKILTCLIAAERCSMDEWVSFSYSAVHDTPADSNHIAMDVNEKLTMEDCLQAILIRSANEVAHAVGEHIAGTGSWKDFAPIMNERASQLGCLNSNFVNPNGLPDENHYTTAYDMAMIGRAFFANEMLSKLSITKQMRIEPSEFQPDLKVENSSNQMLPGRTYAYEYLTGAKTGYTNAARSTLVTCAEKDGLKLICVVMKDESPQQYEDTIALFNYGFNNFTKANISTNENRYHIESSALYSDNAIFGSSSPILALDTDDYVILPKTASFNDLESSITYEAGADNQVALVSYTFRDVFIGSAALRFVGSRDPYGFDSVSPSEDMADAPAEPRVPYKTLVTVVAVIAGILAVALAGWGIYAYLNQFQFSLPGALNRDNSHKYQLRAARKQARARHRAEIKRARERQRYKRRR